MISPLRDPVFISFCECRLRQPESRHFRMWGSAATIGNYLRHGWEEIAAKSPKRPASEHHQQARLVITRPCIIIKPTVIMILASTKWGMSTLTRVKMPVEGLEPAKHRKADAAGGDRADVHAFDLIGARDAVGDVPAALHHPLVGGNVVPHEPRIIITTCSETLIELL